MTAMTGTDPPPSDGDLMETFPRHLVVPSGSIELIEEHANLEWRLEFWRTQIELFLFPFRLVIEVHRGTDCTDDLSNWSTRNVNLSRPPQIKYEFQSSSKRKLKRNRETEKETQLEKF